MPDSPVPDAELPVEAARLDRVALTDPVFISDLHLSDAQPATCAAFARFCADIAPRYRELLILGDLFEYWAGDDDGAGGTGQRVAAELARLAGTGIAICLMHGNRDLLLGPAFAAACGARLLGDPVHADCGGAGFLLAHGDRYCTLDLPYQAFRAQARDPRYQRSFLARPLAERRALVGAVRAHSEAGKQSKSMTIMDVTPAAIEAALAQGGSGVVGMIHGHTHRPGSYPVGDGAGGARRWVLPDWDHDTSPPRGGFLDLRSGAPTLHAFD